MAKALDVALYFACKGDADAGDSITNLKIQKLLYYAQGASLAIRNCPLFEENIYAWQYGPVVELVYHKLKKFGSGQVVTDDMCEAHDRLSEAERDIADEVYDVYGQFSGWKLRDMTHSESPWKDTNSRGAITLKKMKEYFLTQLTEEE